MTARYSAGNLRDEEGNTCTFQLFSFVRDRLMRSSRTGGARTMILKTTDGSEKTQKQPGTPERYTSYHSDKTFSILDSGSGWARRRINENSPFSFEFNGKYYTMEPQHSEPIKKWYVISHGLMYKYLMPWSGGEGEREALGEFIGDTFDEFIDTFVIEGKTVRWILEHQKEWKFKMTAKHFEEILTGFSFTFIYRNTPCRIAGGKGERHFSALHGVRFDPSGYAPNTPGAPHWFDESQRLGAFSCQPEDAPDRVWISSGPFRTDAELLDTVVVTYATPRGVVRKTLREIFDTEYDDGEVFCGMFEG
jgi:hypothetical protein